MNKSDVTTFTAANNYAIDERRFMSDLDIDNSSIMDSYQTLIANQQYTDAKNLLDQSDIFSFSAWYFNMINNRIHAIDDYLLHVIAPRPEYTKYQDPEPSGVDLWTTWVSGLDQFGTIYTITIDPASNGSVYCIPVQGITGDIVQLYVNADFGYVIDTWNIISGGITIDSDNKFVIDTADVEIEPSFKLGSMNNFAIYFSSNPPTGLTQTGAVNINLNINAMTSGAIYGGSQPQGAPLGTVWIGAN